MNITIMIGNSDNKLSQYDWATFVKALRNLCVEQKTYLQEVFFSGGSPTEAPWQNYCIVGKTEEWGVNNLRPQLRELAKQFKQDSIAIVVGESELVPSAPKFVYAVGDLDDHDGVGMWYGPVEDVFECRRQTGNERSRVFRFVVGTNDYEIVNKWNPALHCWAKSEEADRG